MRRQGMWMLGLAACLALTALAGAENWPRFRGSDGSGVSAEQGIPGTWDADAIAWTTELPGVGHSAPAIWDQHLFVTSATAETGVIRELHALHAELKPSRRF